MDKAPWLQDSAIFFIKCDFSQFYTINLDRERKGEEAKDHSIPHFFVIFTRMNITKATMMNVIKAPIK